MCVLSILALGSRIVGKPESEPGKGHSPASNDSFPVCPSTRSNPETLFLRQLNLRGQAGPLSYNPAPRELLYEAVTQSEAVNTPHKERGHMRPACVRSIFNSVSRRPCVRHSTRAIPLVWSL